MILERPYFLENEKWYRYTGEMYKLTKEAPQEAVNSYIEHYVKKKTAMYGKEKGEQFAKKLKQHLYDDEYVY